MKSSKTLRVTLAGLAVTGLTAMSSPYVFAQEGGEGAPPNEGESTSPETQPEGEGAGQGENAPDLTNIPESAKLEITKLTPDEKTAASTPDGTEETITDQAKRGIQGVTFTAYKVEGIDLGTNEGWIEANRAAAEWKKLTKAQKESATTIKITGADNKPKTLTISETAAWTGETGANGVVTSGALDRAFYVVKESIAGETVTIDGKKVPAEKILQADPFVVAVPMTNQDDRTKWLDTVRVYPKNSVQDAEKSLKDDETPGTGNDAIANSKIKYSIGAPVAANTKYKNFEIVDPLDARVELKATDVKVKAEPAGKELVKDTDYTVEVIPADDTTKVPSDAMQKAGMKKVGSILLVKFTEEGLKKLNDGITKVNVDFDVRVKDTAGSANIPNEGYVFPNEPFDRNKPANDPDQPPNIPTNKVVSKYGKVTLTKVSSENDNTKLQGAKFELYECNKAKELGKKVMVDNLSEWTTNSEGVLTIDGLQLNDFKNNSEGFTVEDATAAGQREEWKKDHFYCLVETEAPNGYEKLVEPVQFQLLQGGTEQAPVYETALNVKNVPNNGGFDLPLTGGKGVVPLIALGGLLVLGAGGYAAVAARRNRNEG